LSHQEIIDSNDNLDGCPIGWWNIKTPSGITIVYGASPLRPSRGKELNLKNLITKRSDFLDGGVNLRDI